MSEVSPVKIEATWIVELNADCPGCNRRVDLLAYPDFWDGRKLQVGENSTIEVVCPECGHDFTVEAVY